MKRDRTRIIAQTLPLEHAREAGRCAQFPRHGSLAAILLDDNARGGRYRDRSFQILGRPAVGRTTTVKVQPGSVRRTSIDQQRRTAPWLNFKGDASFASPASGFAASLPTPARFP
jgi:hypothetical protein